LNREFTLIFKYGSYQSKLVGSQLAFNLLIMVFSTEQGMLQHQHWNLKF